MNIEIPIGICKINFKLLDQNCINSLASFRVKWFICLELVQISRMSISIVYESYLFDTQESGSEFEQMPTEVKYTQSFL